MLSKRLRHIILAIVCIAAAMGLSGCATPTAVSAETSLQGDEGLVVLRLVDTGTVAVKRFVVVSTTSGQEHTLRALRFGQTSSMTYVGRLPAGRYQPAQLIGTRGEARLTVPLKTLTGQFDVQPRRVTQLGTMVFTPIGQGPTTERDAQGWSTKVQFVLPLDPTPVASKDLLAARFPELAKTVDSEPGLGWVPGTVPVQPQGLMAAVRSRVEARSAPRWQASGFWLSGGPLGLVARLETRRPAQPVSTGSVHAIEAAVQLRDGRWLAGGEEGFIAASSDQGAHWQRLSGLGADEVVIHLSQAADGRVYLVTDRDREAVVYRAEAATLAWQPIHRIPADREQGAMHVPFGEAAAFLPDFADASADRLVVHARPSTLASLDLRTGQWETHETPRPLRMGLQVTPDGHVVGAVNPLGVYSSLDYGKTWSRLETPFGGAVPRFADRRRGMLFARVGGPQPFRFYATEDGGKTWQPGASIPWLDLDAFVWPSNDGEVLHRVFAKRVQSSHDQGITWR